MIGGSRASGLPSLAGSDCVKGKMSAPPPSPDDGYTQYFPANQVAPGYYAPPPAVTTRGGAAKAGWIVLLVGLAVACIPGAGFLMWFIGAPVCLAGFILAIIGMAKDEVASGVMLLIASMVVAPLAYFASPLVVAGLIHALTGKPSSSQQSIERILHERGFPAPVQNGSD